MKSTTKLLIMTLIILSAAFVFLSVNVVNGNLQKLNDNAYSQIGWLINPALTSVMIGISNIGEWFIYLPIAVLFLVIPKSRFRIGIPVTLTISASALLNFILKHIFAIERPDIRRLVSITGYGFPSGHAMNGTVFIGVCAYLFIKYTNKRILKITIITVSFIFMLLMSFSRIYLGVHTLTDVIGGCLAGFIIIILYILILKWREFYNVK